MISIYQLKSRFQNLLRPTVTILFNIGVTANMVTLAAMIISFGIGLFLYFFGFNNHKLFYILPIWMFFRMALNAIDGMLAREFGQQSDLGAYLNELTDVLSDGVLYLPFALFNPFSYLSIGIIIFLSAISEMSGVIGPMIGVPRQYQGPVGKSDRAFIFGALGLYLAIEGQFNSIFFLIIPIICLGIILNIFNRIRGGLVSKHL